MKQLRFPSLRMLLSMLIAFAQLVLATGLSAQKGVQRAAGPGPAFDCGVCDKGYTPLNGANWQLCWRQAPNQGLVIQHACFYNKQVLSEASQPFVIVPYHNLVARFKDGFGNACGGVPYRLTTDTVATAGPDDDNPGYPASSGFPAGPAYDKLELAATYDTFNYRYRQRWIFHGTGDIDALFGFGGFLLPSGFRIAHVHSPYWRLDFDIDDYTQNFVEEFSHPNIQTPDTRTQLLTDGPRIGNPAQFQNWRVRSNTVNAQGNYHSWEVEPLLGRLTELTTADFWAVTFNPDAEERGFEVGHTDCTDQELSNLYSRGASLDGADVVLWISASSHHEPRQDGEEGGGMDPNHKQMPGHEWVGIHITPRDFLDTTPTP